MTQPAIKQIQNDLEHSLLNVALHADNAGHQRLALRYLGATDVMFQLAKTNSLVIPPDVLDTMQSEAGKARKLVAQSKWSEALDAAHAAVTASSGGNGAWEPIELPPPPPPPDTTARS